MARWPWQRDKEPEAAPESSDGFDQARDALAAGDVPGAVRSVRAQVLAQERLVPLALLQGVALGGDIPALSHAATAVETAPTDPSALFRLGYELVEIGTPDLAVPVLRQAYGLQPDSSLILSELVLSLDEIGRNAESARLLREAQPRFPDDFMVTYLLAFDSVLAGDLATARATVPGLPRPANPGEAMMLERVQRMLRRADDAQAAGRVATNDLLGWHFVTTGGLLVGRAPQGPDDQMNGRWAYLQDSYANVALGLQRAREVLAACEVPVTRVVPLSDRGSHAVALPQERCGEWKWRSRSPMDPGSGSRTTSAASSARRSSTWRSTSPARPSMRTPRPGPATRRPRRTSCACCTNTSSRPGGRAYG